MNREEQTAVNKAAKYWYDSKSKYQIEKFGIEQRRVISIDNYLDRKFLVLGLKPKIYMWSICILFLYVFFVRDYYLNRKTSSEAIEANKFTSNATNYILFEKPNNNSKIIIRDAYSQPIQIIEETKFYYKVNLIKESKTYIGFIKKDKIKK